MEKLSLWLWLSAPLALLVSVATAVAIFVPDFYHRDTLSFGAQGLGQDVATLIVAVPALLICAFLARRGVVPALLIWWGVLIYVAYSYVAYAFDVQFNRLFLVYTAILGLSVYMLIGSLSSIDAEAIKAAFGAQTPLKPVAILLGITCVLFYMLWLKDVIPGLIADQKPLSVAEVDLPTNPIHVLDMALFLPLLALTAIWLWRDQAAGYLFAAPVLVFGVILGAAIIGMGISMAQHGVPTDPGMLFIFIGIIALDLGFLIWFLLGMRGASALV